MSDSFLNRIDRNLFLSESKKSRPIRADKTVNNENIPNEEPLGDRVELSHSKVEYWKQILSTPEGIKHIDRLVPQACESILPFVTDDPQQLIDMMTYALSDDADL